MRLKPQTLELEMASRAMEYRQLARKAGITETTLRAARNGEEIRNATAGKIAAALGVRVDQIMEVR